jgi:hypothetical protein
MDKHAIAATLNDAISAVAATTRVHGEFVVDDHFYSGFCDPCFTVLYHPVEPCQAITYRLLRKPGYRRRAGDTEEVSVEEVWTEANRRGFQVHYMPKWGGTIGLPYGVVVFLETPSVAIQLDQRKMNSE